MIIPKSVARVTMTGTSVVQPQGPIRVIVKARRWVPRLLVMYVARQWLGPAYHLITYLHGPAQEGYVTWESLWHRTGP
ncbi:hypothetical protein [Nonomuraea angiospora]